jgi:predicted dehydrogenase
MIVNRTGAGVIGTGFAASAHVDALKRAGVELVAVAGSSHDKAENFAASHGIQRAYGDPLALIADDSVEVVHNCSPNHLHAEFNGAVLDASKHLLSEKPLGVTSRETAVLVDAANNRDVITAVCFNYRYYPLVREAKDLIERGEMGTPHLIHGGYLQDWLLYETDWNWRLETTKGGRSRAMADIGSHWLDLVQHITRDPVVEVCAQLSRLHEYRERPETAGDTFTSHGKGRPGLFTAVGTEDYGAALLRFRSGARGAFHVSQVSAGHKNRLFFEVDARRASLAWDQEEPNRLWIGHRDRPNSELVRDPDLLSEQAASLAHYPGGHTEGWGDALRNLMLDFYTAVAARQRSESYAPHLASFADAHQSMRLVEAIVRSDQAGSWERIDDEGVNK